MQASRFHRIVYLQQTNAQYFTVMNNERQKKASHRFDVRSDCVPPEVALDVATSDRKGYSQEMKSLAATNLADVRDSVPGRCADGAGASELVLVAGRERHAAGRS